MTVSRAAGTRILALILLATAGGLAGCESIDASLGGTTEQAAQPPANPAVTAAPETGAASAAPVPETAAPGMTAPAPPPVIAAVAPPPTGAVRIVVEPGTDTGTAVGHKVAELRGQLQALVNKLGGDAQRLAELKNSSAQATGTFQQTAATIQTRLAVGTTPGNPELINQWNAAQNALDTITGNINALSKVAGDLGGDSAAAHGAYDSVQATYNLSGGIDEDQRQLNVLADEASQTMIVSDRLKRDATQAIQRQTAYVANERGSLTALASAIRTGEYMGSSMNAPPTTASIAAPPAAMASTTAPPAAADAAMAAPPPAGSPIVTIKFDRARVAYEKPLYSALSQALATEPKASFSVVGVAPARDTEAATRLAANNAQRDAKAVVRTMGDMGVPPTRMDISAATDPAISASEVRVYVK
jgi:hypothetical protein